MMEDPSDFARAMKRLSEADKLQPPSTDERAEVLRPDAVANEVAEGFYWRSGSPVGDAGIFRVPIREASRHTQSREYKRFADGGCGILLDQDVRDYRLALHSHAGAPDAALDEPVPTPRAGTLAIPAPYEIMHPDGNKTVNSRIIRALMQDQVTPAQQLLSQGSTQLRAMFSDPMFMETCSAIGVDPALFLRAQASPAEGDDDAVRDAIKKLAVVLVEFGVRLQQQRDAERHSHVIRYVNADIHQSTELSASLGSSGSPREREARAAASNEPVEPMSYCGEASEPTCASHRVLMPSSKCTRSDLPTRSRRTAGEPLQSRSTTRSRARSSKRQSRGAIRMPYANRSRSVSVCPRPPVHVHRDTATSIGVDDAAILEATARAHHIDREMRRLEALRNVFVARLALQSAAAGDEEERL